jgi:hypothetical protein
MSTTRWRNPCDVSGDNDPNHNCSFSLPIGTSMYWKQWAQWPNLKFWIRGQENREESESAAAGGLPAQWFRGILRGPESERNGAAGNAASPASHGRLEPHATATGARAVRGGGHLGAVAASYGRELRVDRGSHGRSPAAAAGGVGCRVFLPPVRCRRRRPPRRNHEAALSPSSDPSVLVSDSEWRRPTAEDQGPPLPHLTGESGEHIQVHQRYIWELRHSSLAGVITFSLKMLYLIKNNWTNALHELHLQRKRRVLAFWQAYILKIAWFWMQSTALERNCRDLEVKRDCTDLIRWIRYSQ